jgi:hypothetical protein
MDAEVNRRLRLRTVLAEAVPSSSPYYIGAAGLSQPAEQRAVGGSRRVAGRDVVIVGRPQKIDQITAFEGFGNETLEEIRQSGVLEVGLDPVGRLAVAGDHDAARGDQGARGRARRLAVVQGQDCRRSRSPLRRTCSSR